MLHGSTISLSETNTDLDGLVCGTVSSPSNKPANSFKSTPRAGVALTGSGVIAFAAVHCRLRWKGEDTGFYGVGFDDGKIFLSNRQPSVFDARAKKIGAREILPGSTVNVRYRIDGRINWLEAIQIVQLAEEESPFMPVMDHT